MTELTKIDDITHRNLKVDTGCSINLAKTSHVLNLNVTEIGKAISSFPVFLTKNTHTGSWALSALTSFKQGHSLFVENGQWTATYQPTNVQTYPFYLVQSEGDPEKFSVGFDASNPAFSESAGEPLFGEDGKPSELLQKISAILEADIQHGTQTYQFARRLEELGVIKAINIIVTYSDGTTQTLQGLHTLDEDKLKLIDAEPLVELNKNGYLTVMHAMLTSIYQLNSLIKRQSTRDDVDDISQIKLEVARDASIE